MDLSQELQAASAVPACADAPEARTLAHTRCRTLPALKTGIARKVSAYRSFAVHRTMRSGLPGMPGLYAFSGNLHLRKQCESLLPKRKNGILVVPFPASVVTFELKLRRET